MDAFDYDDHAWVVTYDRVAGRIWITTTRPDDEPATIEVVVIATILDGRIHRLWELKTAAKVTLTIVAFRPRLNRFSQIARISEV